MAKNVTGGIILILGGSALIALAATEKGRAILNVLTNRTSSGSQTPTVGAAAGSASGFGGFSSSPGSGRGGGGQISTEIIPVSDYKKILTPGAFVGERGAIPL